MFGRRGCGKTLLLHYSASELPENVGPVYLNCEDFKKHSFPNVLIEILDALFAELQSKLTGWFGKKKRSRDLIIEIRRELQALQKKADSQPAEVRSAQKVEHKVSEKNEIKVGKSGIGVKLGDELSEVSKLELARKYSENRSKIRYLDMWLPKLKQQIREFFQRSSSVQAMFLQIDDFYHLSREDQAPGKRRSRPPGRHAAVRNRA